MKNFFIIIFAVIVAGGGILLLAHRSQHQPTAGLANPPEVSVEVNAKAPEAIATAIGGNKITLSQLKGKKVMLWLFATWCSSCSAGAQTLAQNNARLNNLIILPLETYGDAGYPGPSAQEFAQNNVPQTLSAKNWLWGDASRETTSIYNPRNYPDVYFLIDQNGIVEDIDGAPAATIQKIIHFANE